MKKVLIVGLLIAAIAGLFFYSNIVLIKTENDKVQKELQAKINQVESEKQDLENRIYSLEKESKSLVPGDGMLNEKIAISNITIDSKEIYTEGVLKGKLYGKFNVKATIINNTSSDVENLKVISALISSIPNYSNQVDSNNKALTIDTLKKGETKDIVFTDYNVNHPDTTQEIVVTVLHNGSINGDIKKINIGVAFPPNSRD